MIQAEAASFIKWIRTPDLRDPFLIVGFHGWSNAGSVSSDTLQYLIDYLAPDLVATLGEEHFVNHAVDRPVAHVEDGLICAMDPMQTEVLFWSNPDADRDVALILGKEPHFHWMAYTNAILEIMKKLSVTRLYTVGGVQDSVSHTAPPVVSVVASSASAVAEACGLSSGMQPANYQGPVSIHSFLIRLAGQNGIEAVSLWGHVPAYLQRSPKVVSTLVATLNKASGMECPLDALRQKSIELDRKIDEALARDPQLRQFVETVEDQEGSSRTRLRDEKVIRIDQFLRRDHRRVPDDS